MIGVIGVMVRAQHHHHLHVDRVDPERGQHQPDRLSRISCRTWSARCFAVFVIAVAACDRSGLDSCIILAFYRNKETVNIDEMNLMDGGRRGGGGLASARLYRLRLDHDRSPPPSCASNDMRYIWLIPLLPGIGAAINGLVGIRSFSRKAAGLVACATMRGARPVARSRSGSCSACRRSAALHDVTLAHWIRRFPLRSAPTAIGELPGAVGLQARSAVGR